ncbi:uncharacterized protein GJ701_005991 isoform 2-T2 [Geothlypis trichas]
MGILERELGEKRGYCSWSAERRESAGNVIWAACEPRPSSLEQGHLRMSHRDSAITPGIHFKEHKECTMQKRLWEIDPSKGLCLPAFPAALLPVFTWAGRMGMAHIYHMKVVLVNLSRSSDYRHSFSDSNHFHFAFPLLFPGAAQDVSLCSVLPRRKGSLCLACPAQLDVAGLCGLARQEQLAVLWSALEPSLAALEGFLFGTACDTPSLCTKSSGKGLTGQEQSPNSSHLGQNLGCWSSQSQEASAPGATLEGSGPAHAVGESEGHRAPLLLSAGINCLGSASAASPACARAHRGARVRAEPGSDSMVHKADLLLYYRYCIKTTLKE